MIKEHKCIISDISLLLVDILKPYTEDVNFSVKYLDHESKYHVIEVFIINGQLQKNDHNKFLRKIKKNNFINCIYTLEEGKLYTILLVPLEKIRNLKINSLQKKIIYETDNKV